SDGTDLRLLVQHQPAVADGLPQQLDVAQTLAVAERVRADVVEDGVARCRLRLVHGDIGAAQQAAGAVPVPRAGGDTDPPTDTHRGPLQVERGREHVAQLRCDPQGEGAVGAGDEQ